jgi:hypothetical protein
MPVLASQRLRRNLFTSASGFCRYLHCKSAAAYEGLITNQDTRQCSRVSVQVLLQDSLPRARLHEDYQKDEATPPVSLTDYLEYVDKKTGFTPLLAAVFWHRTQAARLVS